VLTEYLSPYLARIQPIIGLHSEPRQEGIDVIYGLDWMWSFKVQCFGFPSVQRVDEIMQRTRAAAQELEENVRNAILKIHMH